MSTTATASRKVIISAQIPRDVRDELERQARSEERTLSAEVRRILMRHLEHTDDQEEA